MAFVLYFFVLLLSAASVMFGLDLMSSPLPSTPNVPIGRSVRQVVSEPAPSKLESAEQQTAKARQEQERQTAQGRQVADRALSPVYPANPGPSAPVVTNGAASVKSPAEPADGESAARSPMPVPLPKPVQQAVAAGEPADCTLTPATAARRFCERFAERISVEETTAPVPLPPSAPKPQTVAVSSPKQTQFSRPKSGKDELAEVVRIVKRQRAAPGKPLSLHPPQATAGTGEMSEVERIVRKMTRGRSVGDIPVIDGSGRVIVVRTGEARAQAYRGE